MKTSLGFGVVLAVGITVLSAGPASAASATIHVRSDFVSVLSDTRANGHYEVAGTALHIWTTGATSTDKVAEYVATSTPLAAVGEPNLEYTNNGGGVPGFQLVVDFDANGTADGILIGEPVYGNDWWLSNGSAQSVKEGAPSHEGGYGSDNHGTLDGWRAAFPNAKVLDFGFSLGSGVKGDGLIQAINFAGTRYTFAPSVVLSGKNACKNDGWKTSTDPVFTNQGECVGYFAQK